MRIGIINRVPLARAQFNQWTPKGADVTLITPYPLAANERDSLKKVIVFKDYDNDLKLAQLIFRLHAQQPFDRLITLSEFDILRVAKLRDFLQIPGQDYFSGTLFRDKLTMKQLAIKQGIKVPPFTGVTTIEEIRRFADEYGFPLILKPVDQAGSKDIFVLKTSADINTVSVAKALASYGEMDLEDFIQGELYHVDGIVNQGYLQFISVSKYLNDLGDSTTLSKSASTRADFTISEASSSFQTLKAATKQLLTPPYLDCGTVHLEFIINPQGQAFFIEMGSRTGGLMITNSIERKYGLVMNEAAYKLQAGFDYQLVPQAPTLEAGFLTVLPQTGRLLKFDIAALKPLVQNLEVNFKIGKVYEGMIESTDYLAIMQFAARSDSEIQTKIAQINHVILQNIIWEK
ncbi:ATP-grasp domain-containing protein [Lactobacillus sp. DCY120]|uniref:ATP-grasp domain-containing protein n=1 Tax=Bombilactobacillus apium TaxID=2675299 RepID=A0A850R878_9LACO|nr:ATP-grasp domain-containing protein [Bombilactobacillus apium]NVY96745.1 ATP-grasp domain-containing protein [Bombilactobacillus apium]